MYVFRLRRDLDRLRNLWLSRQRQLKHQMIFATINVIKSWDLGTFQALGPAQRESILRALNEDAEKLLSEYGPRDPAGRRLRQEMDECNQVNKNKNLTQVDILVISLISRGPPAVWVN